MGMIDDLKTSFGDDVLDPRPTARPAHSWAELCPCGHTDRYHSPSIGGTYQLRDPYTKRVGGVDYVITTVLAGCVGAPRPKNAPTLEQIPHPESKTGTDRVVPSCPCDEFRPVAKIDKPNRLFNQRMPLNRTDPVRHPFLVGCRALGTHLSRRKDADPDRGGDPAWATAEFDKRLVWLDGARVCGLSKCTATGDGVWPVFIDGVRSELRCAAHR